MQNLRFASESTRSVKGFIALIRRFLLPYDAWGRDAHSAILMIRHECPQAFKLFVRTVLHVFGPRYLNRDPSVAELRRITAEYAEEGFNGCIGSVDCMHISWKQFPLELKGQ
jgi:Plant transposon protein